MKLHNVVVRSYRQLKDVEFAPSNWTVVVGPNGSGKSTLARAMEFAFLGVHSVEVHAANGIQGLREMLGREVPLSVDFAVRFDKSDWETFRRVVKAQHDQWASIKGGIFLISRIAQIREQGRHQIEQVSYGVKESGDLDGNRFDDPTRNKAVASYVDSSKLLLIPAERKLGSLRDNAAPGQPTNGERLMQVLFNADTNRDSRDDHKYEQFARCMRATFPEFSRIKPVTRNNNSDLDFGSFPSVWVGSGHREAASIVGEIACSSAPIIIIEEPERSFHPGLIRHFLECLRSEFVDRQFIIVTHSPAVVAATDAADIWEFQRDFTLRRVGAQDAAAVSERLGVRTSDILDYELLLFVEGKTDAAAWNEWFKLENLERKCRAIDIEGFGNAQYYANAKVISSRVNRPIVCIAFDGDILAKRGGKDNVEKAKPLCAANDGQGFECNKDTLEEYLLDANILGRAYSKDSNTLGVWISEARSALEAKKNAALKRNPDKENTSVAKDALEDVLWKIGEHTYGEDHAAKIASAMTRGQCPLDRGGKDIIGQLKELLAERKKKQSS